jgi:hypothetical protein
MADMLEQDWQFEVPNARAALEALREPSEEMVEAMEDAANWFGPPDEKIVTGTWQAGIDAALKARQVQSEEA